MIGTERIVSLSNEFYEFGDFSYLKRAHSMKYREGLSSLALYSLQRPDDLFLNQVECSSSLLLPRFDTRQKQHSPKHGAPNDFTRRR